MAEDLYQSLGVAKTASADEIRRAYRKLARKHHPDVNPGDKQAEDRFKQVTAAYEVLSDEQKRRNYDEFGAESLRGGFDPAKAREYQRWRRTSQASRAQAGGQAGPEYFDFGGADLGDLFGGLGGFRARRGPHKGQDLRATVELELEQAIRGAELVIEQPTRTTIRIPPGADDGSLVRIPGKGAPGAGGGPPGDLVIETHVRPHRLFRREGLDLSLTLPVTVDEAYNGATVEVPTFDGPVRLKIPPRSQQGQRLRMRGKGVPRKDRRGDLFAVLDVRLPDGDDEAFASAAREAAAAYTDDVRKEVRL